MSTGPQEVVLTGTFDNWSKTLYLVKQADGSFELTVPLPTHNNEILYKYIVDGQWKVSPTEKVVTDESGIENNRLDASDLYVSKNAGSRIPESGGLFVAGNNSKKGDLNTTVLPSAEGKHATVAGEPGIQIPQDKDSLAAFTKFENSNEKDLKTTVLPSSEGQHASIAGEPGIQVPQDKDSLAAFTKFENTGDKDVNTSELTPEEKKKQKKKVKRSQYKAKKKKKAAEAAGAFGAGGATAGGFYDASKGVPEVSEGTEGNDITTTEGETEPEATPEPQTLDPQAREVQNETKKDKHEEEIIAAAGLSGVGAGVGAAAATGYSSVGREASKVSASSSNYDSPSGDKDTGAVALGDVPAEKSNAYAPSGLDSQQSESNNEFLPVIGGAPVTSQGTDLSKSQAGDKLPSADSEVEPESSKDNKHGALGGAALGGAALAGGAAASHFGGDAKSDLPEYAGDASHFVDEKKSSLPPAQFSDNRDSELPNYGGSDSKYLDEKKQGGAIAGDAASAPVASSSRDQYTAPQYDPKIANEPTEVNPSAEETSKAEKYGAPALGGAAIAGTGYAAASSGPEKDIGSQAVSKDVPEIYEERVTSTLDPKAKEAQPLNKETEPLNKETQPLNKEAQPLSKETQPIVGGISNDSNAEKEVDASPVTGREGAPPLTQFASADEIVIAQGAGNKTNVEAELRAREHGDVIVEEIQPTESEKQRLTEEAHVFDNSNGKSTSEVIPTNNSKATSSNAAPAAAGTSSKKATPAKKDAKKESKKDAKKDEKKKKGFFSKLKSVFK
ncbi:unnamed protein product [Debaryomyces fabryi]|nr:unnamed protein product [Debaryomyces fabryi]